MALVYWTQDLNTGFADVDEQHQILVDHFNKLDDAFKSADYEATKKELQDLIDYTIFHFGEEEKNAGSSALPHDRAAQKSARQFH